MKQYFNHIKLQEPHERRKHALRWAGGITSLFFFAWVVTLPMRLNSTNTALAPTDGAAQTAAALQANSSGQNQLEVSTTTSYTP